MSLDSTASGRAVAAHCLEVAPGLMDELLASGPLRDRAARLDPSRARREWECFAMFACLRGLVAARGFGADTVAAIQALHEAMFAAWRNEAPGGESFEARRARLSERYAEYEAIGQDGGARGATTAAARLGEAGARHVLGWTDVLPVVAGLFGSMHESLAESVVDLLRDPARGGP